MGKRVFVLVFAATAACAMAPIASCLDATELDIDITTNADCNIIGPLGALIQVGPPNRPPTTSVTTNACTLEDGTTFADMGDIVVLPSGDVDSVVAIDVVASVDSTFKTADCLPADKSKPCIYARRQIAFLPHARLYLPIELDALCAHVVCDEGFTCDKGACIPDTIDPHQCDGSCTPQPDSGGVPDVIISKDVTIDVIADSPGFPDVTIDAPCSGTICNKQCVNLSTDKLNCGACGFDCSGGVCSNGTCKLDINGADSSTTSLGGTCLAVYNGSVWVSTTTGIAKVPVNGGAPTFVSTVKAYTVASYPTDVAWIESGTTSSIHDVAANKDYPQTVNAVAELMAMSSKGYVWSDYSKSNVWVQPSGGGTPSSYFTFQQGQLVPVAMASNNVYWTVPTGTLYWSNGNTQTNVGVSLPGAVIVDDPTSTTANLFVVEKGNQIEKYAYNLNPLSLFATSTLTTLGALAYDGQTLYANGITEIQKAQGSTMVTVANATSTEARCLAVDGTAVYWLEQSGGVYKHAK